MFCRRFLEWLIIINPARGSELLVAVIRKPTARSQRRLMETGELARRLREELGVTQVQLARKIRIEPTSQAKIELGKQNITLGTPDRIFAGLERGDSAVPDDSE